MTFRPLVAALALASSATLCCTVPSEVVAAPVGSALAASPGPRAPGPRWLVWTRERAEDAEATPDDVATTWTVDASGDAVPSAQGILVAARGGVWEWRDDEVPVVTHACAVYDDQGNELPDTGATSEPGIASRITLRRSGSDETMTLVSPPHDADGIQELRHGARVVASVGPYLFVHESTYVNACGAHGNVGCDSFVWDTERGEAVWNDAGTGTPGMVDPPTWGPARDRALTRLGATEDVASFAVDGTLDLTLTELVPAYDPDVRLGLSLQFTAGACYACSDGAWSSYTASTLEPVPSLPGNLASWAAAPDGVRAFAHRHADVRIGGWSELPRT